MIEDMFAPIPGQEKIMEDVKKQVEEEYGKLREIDLNDKSEDHWTDKHIRYDECNGVYVSYDEAGSEHGRHDSYNSARDALVIYGYDMS